MYISFRGRKKVAFYNGNNLISAFLAITFLLIKILTRKLFLNCIAEHDCVIYQL